MVILAIVICTTIAGMLIGLPTLRLRGDYIAIVTLAFGEIIGRIVINGDELAQGRPLLGARSRTCSARRPTGGQQGITPVDKIDFPLHRAVHSRSTSDPGTGRRSCWSLSCCS